MIVVDMESTGVEPHKNSLVSVGAVDFDNPENQFYMECRVFEGARIDEAALKVNGFTREEITDPKKPSDREVVEAFIQWAETCKEQTLAGQNPSVDRDFLKYTAERYHIDWPFAHRVIDLHSIAYFHMLERGITPPVKEAAGIHHTDLNLDKTLLYVGLPEEPRPHNGLRGAKLEAEAFSRLFYGAPFIKEYSVHPVPVFKPVLKVPQNRQPQK
jgi:DNA polymerase III epsilon subunit-like protein